MCDFLQRLHTLLSSSDPCEKEFHRGLSTWNDDIERFVQSTVELERVGVTDNKSIDDNNPQIDLDSVSQTFLTLRIHFLEVISGNTLNQSCADFVNDVQCGNKYDILLDSIANDWRNDKVAAVEKIHLMDVCRVLRTTKNCWRWYIQVYLPSKRRYRVEMEDGIVQNDLEMPWRSKRLLETLLNVLEVLSPTSYSDEQLKDNHLRNGCQYATQLFFYVTYPISANKLSLMDSYHYMITECNLMERFLRIVIQRYANTQLQLSIVRNVHNALASFPQQSTKAVTTAVVDVSTKSANCAEWIKEDCRVTYKSFFRDLALCILSLRDDTNNKVELLHETGADNTNVNAELMVEVLRCCYALRIGLDLDNDQSWHLVIEKVLQLDSMNNMHYFDCKLAITCILMEGPEFRKHLSTNSVESLLEVLNQQVMTVQHENYIDDRAAAALNPILAVMYKLCVECPDDFVVTIREKVFPKNSLVCNNEEICEPHETPKNMSPIDAPEGTLRWRLIKLLTWPNSFVKRLTGELLFVLCNNKQQEFIRRVGIGNAVTVLSLKGLIDLPASVHS
jgi:Guanine nucleotide exchange factor synembryn